MIEYVSLRVTHKQAGMLRAGLASYMAEMDRIIRTSVGEEVRTAHELAMEARQLSVMIGNAEIAMMDERA